MKREVGMVDYENEENKSIEVFLLLYKHVIEM